MEENELSRYINRFHHTLYRLAYSYMKNADDSEDIIQEAFLKLYQTEQHFETDENVKAWLIRVTINLCKDALKSTWLKGRTELSSDITCNDKEESILGEYMNKLKPEYRAALLLFYFEGYSVKELAKICGISVSAATTRLSRARKQLKKLLLKEGYDER